MSRKLYEAPAVKKVRLVISNAILSVCHTSSNSTPANDPLPSCHDNPGCYT
jgi:hypothetical protein